MEKDKPNLPERVMPCCGYKIDSSADLWSEESQTIGTLYPKDPKPGDITICFKCGTLLTFTSSDGEVRLARAGEVHTLSARGRRVLRTVQKFIRERRHRRR